MAVDEGRLRALVSTMDLEAKVRLLTGADFWSSHPEPAVGLRAMVLSDGPSGVRGPRWDEREPSLNLPSATALAATWDLDTARRYGAVLAGEARRKGVDVVLGPTINLHRSPLGGRHFEAYSEDPLLTGRLAAAYVAGVQEHGVGATPKHYVANDFETDRFTADVRVGDRALRELYLAAFEPAVREAGAWLVMSAYNSVNGTTMTENPLLAAPLCDEWGFDGVVVSDWTAVRSTEAAALARQDLAMPGPHGPWGDALVAAVRGGRVPESAIDEKVLRLLRLAARVGALDAAPGPAGPDAASTAAAPATGSAASATAADTGGAAGVEFARQVAADGMVLLRNAGELPWPVPGPRSVAVLGQHAALARTQGGGSATVLPEHIVTPLAGIRTALPDAEVTWRLGAVAQPGLAELPLDALTDPESGEPGVRAVFRDADGTVLLSERRRATRLVWLDTAPPAARTLSLTTRYRPDTTGTARLGVAGVGRLRLSVAGGEVLDRTLVDDGTVLGGAILAPPSAAVPVELTAGEPVELRVEYELPADSPFSGTVSVGLGAEPPGTPAGELIAEAVAAARDAEVAVVIVGTSAQVESEGFDRTGLALPGAQDELVTAVAAANPRTVVVVNAGSPVLMPWRDEVAAVLLAWFGGQQLGGALSDVLLGHREPGGRLPTTWPAAEADVPVLSTTPVDGVLAYDEDIHLGYRGWLRAGRAQAYPFGFGLGYTSWRLADLSAPASLNPGEGMTVRVRVRNTGARAGKQVVQLYLSRLGSAVDRPVRWLAGFATVRLDAGAERIVDVEVAGRAFQHWDGGWRTEAGEYTLHAGTDVVTLPLTAVVTIKPG